MSVHKTSSGGWRVRWREHGRNQSKGGFRTRRDAERYDAKLKEARLLSPLGLSQLDKGALTVDEFVAGPFSDSLANVTAKTRAHYAGMYRCHLAGTFADVPLREVSVEMVAAWQAERQRAGVGHEALRRSHKLLGQILQRAFEGGRIPSNPQRLVKRPKAGVRKEVRPLAPVHVEALRAHMLRPEPVAVPTSRPGQRKRRAYQTEVRDPLTCHRDAVLVSVLAYAGLRPSEALRLTWGNVQDRTLIVNATKTGKRRSVRLLSPLASDLAAWKLASTNTGPDSPVFPSHTGDVWTEHAYQSWRRRTFDTGATAIGRADATPYNLRHSFVSLLLHEGRSVVYVARQAGHAATETLNTYGHVMDEMEDAPQLPAEDAIRAVRGKDVPSVFPRAATDAAR